MRRISAAYGTKPVWNRAVECGHVHRVDARRIGRILDKAAGPREAIRRRLLIDDDICARGNEHQPDSSRLDSLLRFDGNRLEGERQAPSEPPVAVCRTRLAVELIQASGDAVAKALATDPRA